MSRFRITGVPLFMLLAATFATASSPNHSTLSLSVDEKGQITAIITIMFATGAVRPPHGVENPPQGLWLVALPFSLDPGRVITEASDLHVAQLDTGQGFSLLVVTSPPGKARIDIRVSGASHIAETPDGKGKLELDLSFGLMPDAEGQLLAEPYCINSYDIGIVLPTKPDEADVSSYGGLFKRKDGQTYIAAADALSATRANGDKVWVSFPNPMQHALDSAKLIITIPIAVLSLFFQAQPLRRRRISWFGGVLLVSAVLLGLAAYFGSSLTKRLDFLIFATVAIFNAAWALFVSSYLLAAKWLQAKIVGLISINGAAAEFVEVKLIDTVTNREVKQRDNLDDGRYLFYIWFLVKGPRHYQVVAVYNHKEEKSEVFEVERGRVTQVVPLNFLIQPVR